MIHFGKFWQLFLPDTIWEQLDADGSVSRPHHSLIFRLVESCACTLHLFFIFIATFAQGTLSQRLALTVPVLAFVSSGRCRSDGVHDVGSAYVSHAYRSLSKHGLVLHRAGKSGELRGHSELGDLPHERCGYAC